MIVVVASIPRSGSMWTYNICRGLLAASGATPLPEKIPPDETGLLAKALKGQADCNGIYCIKTHKFLNSGLPGVKLIFTYRDVRECLFSYMRFTGADFEQAIDAVKGMMKTADHYFDAYMEDIYTLRYERIISESEAVIGEICKFLDLGLGDEDFHTLARNNSRENMKSVTDSMAKLRITSEGELLDKRDQERYQIIRNLNGSFRCYDSKTGLQTNHVSTKGEEWRTFLTADQRDTLGSVTNAWLEKYGYKE